MHSRTACYSSIDILGGQAWSYCAIPLIYIFMMLIRTGCLALFNLTAFAWLKERELAGQGGDGAVLPSVAGWVGGSGVQCCGHTCTRGAGFSPSIR